MATDQFLYLGSKRIQVTAMLNIGKGIVIALVSDAKQQIPG